MIRRDKVRHRRAEAEKQRRQTATKTTKHDHKRVHQVADDPDDPTEYLFALARDWGHMPQESAAIARLLEGHIICASARKLLFRGNMFLIETTRLQGWRENNTVFQILPIELLANKELLLAAFQLWDPTCAGGNLYADFKNSLKTSRLLLQ